MTTAKFEKAMATAAPKESALGDGVKDNDANPDGPGDDDYDDDDDDDEDEDDDGGDGGDDDADSGDSDPPFPGYSSGGSSPWAAAAIHALHDSELMGRLVWVREDREAGAGRRAAGGSCADFGGGFGGGGCGGGGVGGWAGSGAPHGVAATQPPPPPHAPHPGYYPWGPGNVNGGGGEAPYGHGALANHPHTPGGSAHQRLTQAEASAGASGEASGGASGGASHKGQAGGQCVGGVPAHGVRPAGSSKGGSGPSAIHLPSAPPLFLQPSVPPPYPPPYPPLFPHRGAGMGGGPGGGPGGGYGHGFGPAGGYHRGGGPGGPDAGGGARFVPRGRAVRTEAPVVKRQVFVGNLPPEASWRDLKVVRGSKEGGKGTRVVCKPFPVLWVKFATLIFSMQRALLPRCTLLSPCILHFIFHLSLSLAFSLARAPPRRTTSGARGAAWSGQRCASTRAAPPKASAPCASKTPRACTAPSPRSTGPSSSAKPSSFARTGASERATRARLRLVNPW